MAVRGAGFPDWLPSYLDLMAVPLPVGWDERARCSRLDLDPDAWYPDTYTFEGEDTRHVAYLRAQCMACPVRLECLADAVRQEGIVAEKARYGVKGATRPDERAAAYREPAMRIAEARSGERCSHQHPGSSDAIRRHDRLGKPRCQECQAGAAVLDRPPVVEVCDHKRPGTWAAIMAHRRSDDPLCGVCREFRNAARRKTPSADDVAPAA